MRHFEQNAIIVTSQGLGEAVSQLQSGAELVVSTQAGVLAVCSESSQGSLYVGLLVCLHWVNYILEEWRGLLFHYDFWKSGKPQIQAELLGQTSLLFRATFLSWEEAVL